MEDVLIQTIESIISDYKNYQLVILIAFTSIIILLQIGQTLWINMKIATFKNRLKKSEIKFSRFNELQINALREIYHRLVKFQMANNLIFKSSIKSIGHNQYKTRIDNWIRRYFECINEFAREKILLSDEMKILVERTIDDFEQVKKILLDEKESLDFYEMEHQGNRMAMYQFEEQEIEIISDKLNRIRDNDSLQNADKHIRDLRERIEQAFLKMM